jgi:hypothetical protein
MLIFGFYFLQEVVLTPTELKEWQLLERIYFYQLFYFILSINPNTFFSFNQINFNETFKTR